MLPINLCVFDSINTADVLQFSNGEIMFVSEPGNHL
jgi:hypothetical protein